MKVNKKKFVLTSTASRGRRKSNEKTVIKNISVFILKCIKNDNPDYFKDNRRCIFVYGGKGYIDNFKVIPKDKISYTEEKSREINFLWSLTNWVEEACDFVDVQMALELSDVGKFKTGKLKRTIEVSASLATEIDNSLVISFDYDVDNEEDHPAGYTLAVVFEKRRTNNAKTR